MADEQSTYPGIDAMVDWLDRSRKYAGFFSEASVRDIGISIKDKAEWDKERELVKKAKEIIISCILAATLPEFRDESVFANEVDPPDCSIKNGTIGIELVELVDQNLANPRFAGQYRLWSDDDIRSRLLELISEKDCKLSKRRTTSVSPWRYEEQIILIYSAEFDIDEVKAQKAVRELTLPSLHEVTRAYLLLSYSPEQKGYPLIKLL